MICKGRARVLCGGSVWGKLKASALQASSRGQKQETVSGLCEGSFCAMLKVIALQARVEREVRSKRQSVVLSKRNGNMHFFWAAWQQWSWCKDWVEFLFRPWGGVRGRKGNTFVAKQVTQRHACRKRGRAPRSGVESASKPQLFEREKESQEE